MSADTAAAELEPSTDGATDTTTTDTTGNADVDRTDWKAEAERWRTEARRHESDAKRLYAELGHERERAAGRFLDVLVTAEFRAAAAAAGRNIDVDALLDGLDPARFVHADGRPDVARIAAVLDGLTPVRPAGPPRVERIDLADIHGT